LCQHYEIEKELATELKKACKEERKHLYSRIYDELYQRVPHHPQVSRKANPNEQAKALPQMKVLYRFLDKSQIFLEIGPGDCRISFEVAKHVKRVIAIDVSSKITKTTTFPENFELILSYGSSIKLPAESVDIAYSNQLMEHLHPDDAKAQLQGIYNALVPGGIYICITPHRFKGPSDISRYFDDIATGLHLKEYTAYELYRLFKTV